MSILISVVFSAASDDLLLVATRDADDVVRVRQFAAVPYTEREIPGERMSGWLRSVRVADGLVTTRRVREVSGGA